MQRIQPLAPESATGQTQAIFEKMHAERGNIPNMFRTLALRPEILEAFSRSLDSVLKSGTVPLRTKEMVAVRVSQLNGCRY